ncbi:MAG: class I SAM-dependent methyltransferase [archaeon]|jgi:SAM-dependent methyltransferase
MGNLENYKNQLSGKKKSSVKELSRSLLYNYLTGGLEFENCIDVGCGRNIFVELMKKNGKKAVGLDRVKTGNDVIVGDVLKTPFKEKSFDLVFSSMVLEHVDHLKFIKEIGRVSRKYCIIITVKPCNAFWDSLDHKRPYTKKALKRLLELENFEPIRFFDIPFVSTIGIVGKKINPKK